MGDTITFTASGVTDGGNPLERVMCSTIQPIPLGGVTYDWTLTVPPGYPAPLPPLTGSGASVTVAAKIPGSYTASFNAKPTRTKCPPAAIALGGSKSVVGK